MLIYDYNVQPVALAARAASEVPWTATFSIFAEFTDTFGGEPNYSWVERKTLTFKHGATDRAIMWHLKKEFGLSNVRGKTDCTGDAWEFRPYKSCTILMARVEY